MTQTPEQAETLAGLMTRSAVMFADHTAVDDGHRSITYRDLLVEVDRRSRELEVATDAPCVVITCQPQIVDTYVAYLATIMSGRTAVPVRASAASDAAVTTAAAITGADTVWDSSRGTFLPSEPTPDSGGVHAEVEAGVAYVLMTSGTTGTPKAVPIHHSMAMSYLRTARELVEMGPGDRASACFSLAFDVSVHDMFVTWSSGATLVLPQAQESMLPVAYAQRGRLTHWFSVPSAIKTAMRLRRLEKSAMPGLRLSLFAGEQLNVAEAKAWAESAPSSKIINLYGPTECTVGCAAYTLPSSISDWPTTSNGTVPIGTPFAHMQYQLDSRTTLESSTTDDDGSRGELLLRGAQRFDGYLGGQALAPGDWYHTGDIVSRDLDGHLVHQGRSDNQIKLRGYRLELGALEFRLRESLEVDDVAVALVTSPTGTPVLAVAHEGTLKTSHDLEDVVADFFPVRVQIGTVEEFDEFPLTPNGKVDRNKIFEAASDKRAGLIDGYS